MAFVESTLSVSTATPSFLSMIPAESACKLPCGALLVYSEVSRNFCPLIIREDEEGNLLVTPQESVPADTLAELFSDADVVPAPTYVLNKDVAVDLFDAEWADLADYVVFCEEHEEIESDILDLLRALKNEGFPLNHVLQVMEKLTRTELKNLLHVNEEMPTFLRRFFIQLAGPADVTDGEDD